MEHVLEKANPAPRRRFLSVAAAAAACAAMPVVRASSAAPVVWKGSALGALASITLAHPDRAYAQAALGRCVDELERLERVFSLYRPDSALSRLNGAGTLAAPPAELVELLSRSLALARASDGAFDPTIQPLYRLYAGHFAAPGAAPEGPSQAAIGEALRVVDFRAVRVDSARIDFARRGMALTLNGIAQGYVTDRVADLLRGAGFRHVLIDLGEARAAGRRADGRAWIATVADPARPSRTLIELALGDSPGQVPALATSAGAGTRFGSDPRQHHLLDPRTGRSANHHAAVSVGAASATIADGLSTALSIVEPARAATLLAVHPSARAYFVGNDGSVDVLPRS